MDPCDHIQHHGMLKCPGLTQRELEFGEKVKSVGLQFTAGRSDFHGDEGTLRERQAEIMANAKKYGNEPPEYVGPRSKMRPYSELAAE